MSILWRALACLPPLSLALTFLLLGGMGRRMGEALHMPPFYRLYWAAAAFAFLATAASLAAGAAGWWEGSPAGVARGQALLVFLPLAIGTCLATYPTMRYWKWIWPELRATRTSDRDGGGC